MATERTKFKLDALYKEYDIRTKEIEFHNGRYHRIVGYVQTYLVSLSSLASYLYINKNGEKITILTEALAGEHHGIIIMALAFLTLFLFFLHATMLDTLYMLISNGSRVGAIEQEINKTVGKEVFQWENKVMPFILQNEWQVVNGALRPQYLVFVITFLLNVLAVVALVGVANTYAFHYIGYFSIAASFIEFFMLFQWLMLLLNGASFLKNKIYSFSNLETVKDWDTDLIRWGIGIFTIVIIGVLMALAIQTDTAWVIKDHPFVMCVFPSVYVGGLFILPFMNRKIYDIIKLHWQSANTSKNNFIGLLVISALTSSAVMFFLQNAWTSDQYTGFMDLKIGELSFAGIILVCLTAIELTIILFSFLIGIKAKKAQEFDVFYKVSNMWNLVLAYAILTLVDLWCRYFVLHIHTLDLTAWLPALLGFSTWLYFQKEKPIFFSI